MRQEALFHKNILETLNRIEPSNDWILLGPVIRARESDIYQATSKTSQLLLAVKHYNLSTNKNAVQQQYNALQKYQGTMTGQDNSLHVPRVYTFDQEQRLLIMEWVKGKSLHQKLWTTPEFLFTKKNTLALCGQWLRTFHAASYFNKKKVILDNYLKGIKKELSKRESKNCRLTSLHQDFTSAYNFLNKAVQQCPEPIDLHAIAHGDFTPYNLILDTRTAVGVDIWASTEKPVLVDLSRMIVYLTIAYPLIIFRKPVFEKSGKLNSIIASLIEGYDHDLIDPRSIHFKIALLSEYLRRWLIIEERIPTAVSLFTDKFQIMQIKKNIKTLIAAMPKK